MMVLAFKMLSETHLTLTILILIQLCCVIVLNKNVSTYVYQFQIKVEWNFSFFVSKLKYIGFEYICIQLWIQVFNLNENTSWLNVEWKFFFD